MLVEVGKHLALQIALPLLTADLQTLADNATAQPLVVAPTGFNTNQVVSQALGVPDAGLPGIADVYVGTIDLPYYFDSTNSLTSFWLPSLAAEKKELLPYR